MEETITHLEMTSPDQLRPARPVAAPHHWPSLSWSDAQWRQWLAHPPRRQWIVRHHADVAGLVELEAQPGGEVEITLDHPNALPNYRSRGFRLFHTEVRKRDLPA